MDIKSKFPIEAITKENPDKCLECLEKIYAAKALKEIKKLVSIKLFNEKNLINRVENTNLFKSYLQILKKQDIIRKFGDDTYYSNVCQEIDLEIIYLFI